MLDAISHGAEWFIGLFQLGGENFMGLVTGIIPMLVVLMTFVNSLIKIIGEDRIDSFAEKISKYAIFRYTLLPVLAVIFLTNPMCYSFGRFLEEKHKPAFQDACISFVHPVTGIFPHANGAELFVYYGIAAGLETLGLPLGHLAVRYFLVGIVVIFIRGVLTERITAIMAKGRLG